MPDTVKSSQLSLAGKVIDLKEEPTAAIFLSQ